MRLSEVRDGLIFDLKEAQISGLLIATDPAKAAAPCVLVGPITEVNTGGACVYELAIPLWLIAPAPGNEQATRWLADKVTSVMEALGSQVDRVTLSTYDVGQGDLPCYEIQTTVLAKE